MPMEGDAINRLLSWSWRATERTRCSHRIRLSYFFASGHLLARVLLDLIGPRRSQAGFGSLRGRLSHSHDRVRSEMRNSPRSPMRPIRSLSRGSWGGIFNRVTAFRCGDFLAARNGLRSRCRPYAAIARRAQRDPDTPRLQLPAPQCDLRQREVDARASEPCLARVGCSLQQHPPLCEVDAGSIGPRCRVGRRRPLGRCFFVWV